MQMGTVPLPKARDHQEEDISVFDFEISDSDMAELCALNERYSSLGSLPY
jgi:diketogulonate reductase-like aldo/keto reductase